MLVKRLHKKGIIQPDEKVWSTVSGNLKAVYRGTQPVPVRARHVATRLSRPFGFTPAVAWYSDHMVGVASDTSFRAGLVQLLDARAEESEIEIVLAGWGPEIDGNVERWLALDEAAFQAWSIRVDVSDRSTAAREFVDNLIAASVRELHKLTVDQQARIALRKALIFIALDRADEACELWEWAHARLSDQSAVIAAAFNCGLAHYKAGRHDQAEPYLLDAFERGDDEYAGRAASLLGRIAARREDLNAARRYLEIAEARGHPNARQMLDALDEFDREMP
jgi:tetratricopeptide (TPR) repeat protein